MSNPMTTPNMWVWLVCVCVCEVLVMLHGEVKFYSASLLLFGDALKLIYLFCFKPQLVSLALVSSHL